MLVFNVTSEHMAWEGVSNQPHNVCLCDYGWEISVGTTSPVRASKPVGPPERMKAIGCSCSSDTPCRGKNCSCSLAGLPCTTFCKCQHMFTSRSVNNVGDCSFEI